MAESSTTSTDDSITLPKKTKNKNSSISPNETILTQKKKKSQNLKSSSMLNNNKHLSVKEHSINKSVLKCSYCKRVSVTGFIQQPKNLNHPRICLNCFTRANKVSLFFLFTTKIAI